MAAPPRSALSRTAAATSWRVRPRRGTDSGDATPGQTSADRPPLPPMALLPGGVAHLLELRDLLLPALLGGVRMHADVVADHDDRGRLLGQHDAAERVRAWVPHDEPVGAERDVAVDDLRLERLGVRPPVLGLDVGAHHDERVPRIDREDDRAG